MKKKHKIKILAYLAVMTLSASMMTACSSEKKNTNDATEGNKEIVTESPSIAPTETPTEFPTVAPTTAPTVAPTTVPTTKPIETTKPNDEVVTEKPTTTPTETEGPAEGSIFTYTKLNKTMYATNSVNVRSNPTVGGDKLGGLTKGQSVKVTGQCNETDWYRIEFNGGIGYVSNGYLSDTKPVEPTEKPTPKPTEKPSEKPKEEETTKPTKNYDGYDAWGNGFVYNDDMNKVFDCDFPLALLKPGKYQVMVYDELKTLTGFFYAEEQFATPEFYEAQGKTQEMYNFDVQGMRYIGHYNGVEININIWSKSSRREI